MLGVRASFLVEAYAPPPCTSSELNADFDITKKKNKNCDGIQPRDLLVRTYNGLHLEN